MSKSGNEVTIYRRIDGMAFGKAIGLLPGVQAELEAVALDRGVKAEVALDTLSRVRTGQSQITVSRGRVDRYVNLVDKAAQSIDYGTHRSRGIHALLVAFPELQK